MVEVPNDSPFDCKVDIFDGTCPEEGGHSFRLELRNNQLFLGDLVCPKHGNISWTISIIHGKPRETEEGFIIPALPLKDQHP